MTVLEEGNTKLLEPHRDTSGHFAATVEITLRHDAFNPRAHSSMSHDKQPPQKADLTISRLLDNATTRSHVRLQADLTESIPTHKQTPR